MPGLPTCPGIVKDVRNWLRGQESNLTRVLLADTRCSMVLATIQVPQAREPFGILSCSPAFDGLPAELGHFGARDSGTDGRPPPEGPHAQAARSFEGHVAQSAAGARGRMLNTLRPHRTDGVFPVRTVLHDSSGNIGLPIRPHPEAGPPQRCVTWRRPPPHAILPLLPAETGDPHQVLAAPAACRTSKPRAAPIRHLHSWAGHDRKILAGRVEIR